MDISNCLDKDDGALNLLKPFGNLKGHFCFFKLKEMSCITDVLEGRLNKVTLKGLSKV